MDNSNIMGTLNRIAEEKNAVKDHTLDENVSEQSNP